MKKGSLNFLGRKHQNLFDTNVEIKDMGHMELMLDSAAIPESGTAKVRSRPTVKHFMSTESLQGFAVPTPKVPVLPSFSEPPVNGTGSARNHQNGGKLPVSDIHEGEMFIPPPPSSAPPPPPSSTALPRPPSFIPPLPPNYIQKSPDQDRSSLHPPPMKPSKPPSSNGSDYGDDVDLAFLRPPPMAPPKPPSDTSSFRGSASSLDVQDIPDCPKFTPPPPPSVVKPPPVLPKGQKMPPTKPIRMSSIPNIDIHDSRSPTPPAVSTPTLSSFNPQNTAKLYNIEKNTILTGQMDKEKRVQSLLLLEDSTGNQVGLHVNGTNGGSLQPVQSAEPPTKPARRNSSASQLENDIPKGLQVKAPSQPAKTEMPINPEPDAPVSFSPKTEKPDVSQVKTHVDISNRPHRYSPVLNHRQKNRGLENTVKKESSTSPFALLMAAKERERQKSNHSRQNSGSSEPLTSVIQPSVEKPNSFIITPREPASENPSVEIKPITNLQPVVPLSTKTDVPDGHYPKSVLSPTPTNNCIRVQSIPFRDVENGEEMLFIPPPPEFANSDPEDKPPSPPPSHPAPAPPTSHPAPAPPTSHPAPAPPTSHPAPTPPTSHPAPAPPTSHPAPAPPHSHPAPPPSHPTPAPPPVKTFIPSPLTTPKPPPKAPGPPPVIQPKPPVQIKPTPPAVQAAPSVTASQATLLSILQKKMLEIDPKFSAVKETDSNDDWNVPDDEGPPPSQIRSTAPPARHQGLNMKELENKAAKKSQDLYKSHNSNGSSSKQPFGKTFTVRPGSKQPITPVMRDASS